MATSIIQETNRDWVYGGELVNGSAVRYLSLVVVYDEHGPFITNYTASGCHDWGFETKRRISTKAATSPDWTNPNGFIIKDEYDGLFGGHPYTLYVNRDNIPDEFYVEGEWRKYMGHALKRKDDVGGCEFLRVVSYPRYRQAKNDLRDAMERYCELTGDGRNHLIALGNREKVKEVMNAVAVAMDGCALHEEDFRNMGVGELMVACGADLPIGDNDWSLGPTCTNHKEYLDGTY